MNMNFVICGATVTFSHHSSHDVATDIGEEAENAFVLHIIDIMKRPSFHSTDYQEAGRFLLCKNEK